MEAPQFRVIEHDRIAGVTYECGCPCEPTARQRRTRRLRALLLPARSTSSATRLRTYLAERKASRTREPEYEVGTAIVELSGPFVPVAWAFPQRNGRDDVLIVTNHLPALSSALE
jgi:hypothetical protein